ncbi:nucleotidyltransferase domain-containing protein [Azospirillum sp.]|uniref:nucleotidyltransferase domain-containing protein n=1 Tax=Azospirillum sp. TaxID=34012 RepID=UPI003D720E02
MATFAGPQAVYLIGSLARGDAQGGDIDINLFVIVDDGAVPEPVALQRLRQNLRDHGVLFDVRACRRSAYEAKRGKPGTMAHSVAREGVLLYGADR